MTPTQAMGLELEALGAELTVQGRMLVAIGESQAATEGHLVQLRDSNHKIANAVAKLADVPELLVTVGKEMGDLRLAVIDAVNRLGQMVYQTRAELGLGPLQPTPVTTEPPANG
jgi:hypothetical protein